MVTKNARLSLLLALALAGTLLGAAVEAGEPPLRGVFRDNFTLLDEPVPAPEASFTGADGGEVALESFRGKVVLLNFWATWCAPCVRELPGLDQVQSEMGRAGLAVVAVSQDRGGLEVVEPFLVEHGLDRLDIYLDPKGEAARAFNVRGLPTTLLIDRAGRLIGAMEGAAEWDGPDAEVLLRYYLDQPAEVDQPVKTSG